MEREGWAGEEKEVGGENRKKEIFPDEKNESQKVLATPLRVDSRDSESRCK